MATDFAEMTQLARLGFVFSGHLFCPDANHSHHPPCLRELSTMREEASRIARGTSLENADVFLANSGVPQLALVGFNQIEVDFGAELAVSRRPLVQEQQRVAHVNCVGVEHLFEEFVSVGELGLELRAHLGPDLITASPNTRANYGAQIARHTAELPPHFADALLDYASDSPAPACMKSADRTVLHVRNQHRNAIGGLNRQ